MAPLLILIICFSIIFLMNKFILNNNLTLSFIGRAALAIMLMFTGITHLTKTESMAEMLPTAIPFKKEAIYFTGILELFASVGLLIQALSKLTSILLMIFFLAILPANIIGSIKQIKVGGMEKGRNYLYFRIPLQFLFIGWAYYFGLKKIN